MIASIDGSTVALIGKALDATAMRQQAVAQNIANANSPGYRRLGVSFEQQLSQLRSQLADGQAVRPAQVDALQARLDTVDGGDKVALDQEIADLSATTLHQQALLKALNRHYAILGVAINGGKQ